MSSLPLMRTLALAAALFAAVAGAAGAVGMAATGALLAAALWLTPFLSAFLRIFVAIFAIEYVVFGLVVLAAGAGAWPAAYAALVPPPSLPVTVGVFGILVVAIGRIPVIRTITGIADRYFAAAAPQEGEAARRERLLSIASIVFLVLVNQAQVGIAVRINFFNRDWINAIQAREEAVFWSQLFAVFVPWVTVYILSAVIEFRVQSVLLIRWRRWLTEHYVADWLGGGTHYRLALGTLPADNPDQRIADDTRLFAETTYSFSIQLLSQVSSLVSFSIILWSISPEFTLPFFGTVIPGFLFWVALLYAGLGTLLTHLLGRRLIPLSFERQHFEADFRFGLARLREYGEQVALLGGEPTEQRSLGQRFRRIVENFFSIVFWRTWLLAFTALYGQISSIIPYAVAAPFYFLGRFQFGTLTQTAGAFGRVEGSLSFFIDRYVQIAEYKAVVDRLTTFDAAILAARRMGRDRALAGREEAADDLRLQDLTVALPDGRPLVRADGVRFEAGRSTLVMGPSGSGKSTLFRAIAGIWPFGEGVIALPKGRTMLLLPQRPYIPIGTLRAAVAYPAADTAYPDEAMAEALRAARLPHLAARLDEEGAWAQILSLGEQQRLAVARALLAKPDWLFLDEATAALDEPTEAAIYRMIAERLPGTTVVSIGHRSTLNALHERRIEMRPGEGGVFTPVAAEAPVPAA